jgi:Formate/nitrite transporter
MYGRLHGFGMLDDDWKNEYVRTYLCGCKIFAARAECKHLTRFPLTISFVAAVWFPVSAFVALGVDHSIANMFFIPLAMMRGAEITIAQMFVNNLIPVTLGNIVGGAICVMAPFGTTMGNWFKNKKE